MSIKNNFIAIAGAVSLCLGMSVSVASFAHNGGGHHGGGHRGGMHHGGGHHSSTYHHGGYHHGGHGYTGYHGRGYRGGYGHRGWYGPGYIVAPGVNRSCHWVPRHRNNFGGWVPARKVCRVY